MGRVYRHALTMSLILSVVNIADALPTPMPQVLGVNILPTPIRISLPAGVSSSRPISSAVNVITPVLSAAPAVVSVAGSLLGAVVNPIVAPTVSSVAVPSETVPAAGLPSANTGTSPLLDGLVGGVVAPLASSSSGSGLLNGLLPVTSPLGGALTGLGGALNNAVGGVADTVGGIASSVGLGDVGSAVETVGAVVGGVAGDTLSAADNVLFGSGVSGALPTGVAGAPLVSTLPTETLPEAPNALDPTLIATNVLSPALSAITDVPNSALLPATDVLDPALPLATDLLALPGDVIDTLAPLATDALIVPTDVLDSGLLSATNVLNTAQSLPTDTLAVPTGVLDNILPTAGLDPGLGSGVGQSVPLYLLTDLPSAILGSLPVDQYGDVPLSALSTLSPDALSALPQDVLSLVGALATDALGATDVLGDATDVLGGSLPTAVITDVLGDASPTNVLGDGLGLGDLTGNLPTDILPTNVIPTDLLGGDLGPILGPITSDLLAAVPTSAPSVTSILPGVTVGAGGGIAIDTPILDAGAGGGAIVAAPPANIPGLSPNVPGFGAQAVPGLVNGLLPQIDPILNILKPSDVGLLTSFPNQIAQALNDAAQHISPNDPKFPGWQAFGCFTSNKAFNGTLTLADDVAGTAVVAMTPQVCIARCVAQNANYASVIKNSCFCSAVAPPADAGSNQCTTLCAGDASFVCGNSGIGAYSVFKRLITPESLVPLPLRTGVNGYQYSGCYYGNGFIDNAELVTSTSTGIDDCSDRASQQGYEYAALQGTTCYVSRTNIAAGLEAGVGLCSTPCSGNSSEACGGTALAVNTGVDLTQLITLYTANPSAITSPALTPDTNSTDPTGPEGSFIGGCVDATAFILATLTNGRQLSNPNNSGALCYTQCKSTNFLYSLVNSASCYCSNTPPSVPAASQSDCNTPCPANTDQRCGGMSSDGTTVLGNVLGTIAIILPLVCPLLLYPTTLRPNHSVQSSMLSTKRKSFALFCREICSPRRRNSCFPACCLKSCTLPEARVLRCKICRCNSTLFLFFRILSLYIVDLLDGGLDAGVRKMIVCVVEIDSLGARGVDLEYNVWIRQSSFKNIIVPSHKLYVIFIFECISKRYNLDHYKYFLRHLSSSNMYTIGHKIGKQQE
jgi:hypothetical protein